MNLTKTLLTLLICLLPISVSAETFTCSAESEDGRNLLNVFTREDNGFSATISVFAPHWDERQTWEEWFFIENEAGVKNTHVFENEYSIALTAHDSRNLTVHMIDLEDLGYVTMSVWGGIAVRKDSNGDDRNKMSYQGSCILQE